MREEAARRDSFVVRIWREKGQQGWKCWVQHTRSGKSAYVRSFGEMQDFMESQASWLILKARTKLK